MLLDFLPVVADHLAQQRPEDRKLIEQVMAEGRILPKVDGDRIRAILTQQLTKTITVLYHQNWFILKNPTEVPFITSDNPSSVIPRRRLMSPLMRFLPLAPDLAILSVPRPNKRREDLPPPGPSSPPIGTVRGGVVDRKRVVRLNRVTIMNADKLVFGLSEDRRVARLIRNHRRFGIAVDRVAMGPLKASTLVVRQKPRG
jgi:hypothetical protein